MTRLLSNGMRLSCAAVLCSSQMQFYHEGRRQLQPLVRHPLTLLSHKRAIGRADEILNKRHECVPATVIDGAAHAYVFVRGVIPKSLDSDLIRGARGQDEFCIVGRVNEIKELRV